MNRLDGKVAIVFGAGPNIGGTVAHFLVREGARTAVSDISEDDVARIVAETVKQVDIAFNMAGKVHWCPVVDMDLKQWTEAVTSFPTAGMLTTKHVARAMIAKERGGGIIHLLSTAAHFGEASGAAYGAAKTALLNFARSATTRRRFASRNMASSA